MYGSRDEEEGDKSKKTNRNKRFLVCLLKEGEDDDLEINETILVIVSRIDKVDDHYDERKVALMRARLLNMAYGGNEYHVREVHPSGIISDKLE